MRSSSFLKTGAGPALAASMLLLACNENTRTVSAPENDLAVAGATASALPAMGAKLDPSTTMAARKISATGMGNIPSSVDLSANMPPIGNQGTYQGSCVGWASAYASKTMAERMDRKWNQNLAVNQFSPSWMYNQISGGNCPGGSYISDALNLLKNGGNDNIQAFPYNTNSCSALPDAASKARALPFAIKDWYTVPSSPDEMKAVLAQGKPLIIGFAVYPDYDNLKATGNTVYDDVSGTYRGRHANAIVGYDDAKGAFKVANSWGTGWGQSGYGWISYSLVGGAGLSLQVYYFDNASVSKSDHSIYAYNSTSKKWEQTANGGGVMMASGPDGIPVIVNSIGEVWRKQDNSLGSSFDKLGTTGASDVAIGKDGKIWILGSTKIPGTNDYPIFRWSGSAWEQAANGGGVRIAVNPAGIPYVVNSFNDLWKKNDNTLGSSFTQVNGKCTDVAFGGNGDLWCLGDTWNTGTNDHPAWKWVPSQNGWVKNTSGGGVRISVDGSGVPYLINSKGEIWKKNDATTTSPYTKLSGLGTDIGIGSKVWITGTNVL